uniref:Uncharacterized protein n=1 Tax=Candidatus Kentrum sp. SD TaxID=2126332 RepID=A0A450YR19_9GAMM|nr:MAG: hypothetical protein BECKSD772F_GA0070984_11634 [Candidatus Kentron sp. SD]VFK49297.1 MAG: hypothetical protein BECKSD772E_GA0070983_11704 [Candidatus Kentron sp. SD]
MNRVSRDGAGSPRGRMGRSDNIPTIRDDIRAGFGDIPRRGNDISVRCHYLLAMCNDISTRCHEILVICDDIRARRSDISARCHEIRANRRYLSISPPGNA